MTERRTRSRIAFANYHAAIGGSITDFEPYLLASRIFRYGILDRTGTLEMGFETHVLDPLADVYATNESDGDFGSLCDQRAEQILAEACAGNRSIDVLWSGGIDSTVTLVALIQAATKSRDIERLRVLLSIDSISEYPAFFHQHINDELRWTPVGFPISRYLSAESITVTGEHGDLLFGSDESKHLVPSGVAYLPWQSGLPLLLAEREFTRAEAGKLIDYITPLIDACPIEIDSLFEFFWWVDFTQKWQTVALRIAASVEQGRLPLFENTRHFFRSIPFQLWALFARERESIEEWSQYKMVAKDYIHDFNGDDDFRDNKEKNASLRRLLTGDSRASRSPLSPLAVRQDSTSAKLAMDENFELVEVDG